MPHTPKQHKLNITRREWIIFANALAVILACYLPFDLYMPSLPHIQAAFHATTDQAQMSFTLFVLGSGLAPLFFGPMSDRFGRRPILITGMVIAMIGTLVILSAQQSFITFLLGRLFEGIGAGAGFSVSRSLTVDTFSGKKLSIIGSYGALIFSLCPIFAPSIGGLLQVRYGWRASFVLALVFLTVVGLSFLSTCPETNTKKDATATEIGLLVKHIKLLLTSPIFMGYMVAAGVANSLGSTYAVIAPFLFQQQYHMNALAFGSLSMLFGGSAMLSKLANTWVVKRFDMDATILLGFSFVFGAGMLLALMQFSSLLTLHTLIVGIFIAYFSIGFLASNAFAGSLSPFKHIAGISSAVYGMTTSLFSFVVSSVVALLPVHNAPILAGSYVLVGFTAAVGFYLCIWRHKGSS